MIGTSRSVWGFDPRSVPGCQLWLDGADQSSMTLSGSNVTQWNDKSLNVSSTTSVAGSNVLTQNAMNGRPAILLNGSSSFTGSTTGSGTTLTICIVATQASECAGNGGLFCFGRSGFPDWNDVGSLAITKYSTNSGQIICTRVTNSQIVNTGNSTPFIYILVFDGTFVNSYLNGTIQTPSNISRTGTFAYTEYKIGTRAGNHGDLFWTGFIGESIVYNTALTTTQRQQIEGYLAHKWGLTGYYDSSIPLSIPGCALWLDAADQSSMTLSGSNVTQWNDKSGNGYNALPNAGGSAITMGTLNGVPAITFPAASTAAFLPSSSLSVGSGGYSVFFVANQTSFASGGTRIYSANSGGIQSAIDNAPSPRILTVVIDGSVMSSTFTMISNVPFMYSYTISSSASGLWKNGISAGTAGGSTTSISNFYIGNFAFPSSSLAFTGQMGEFLIYNSALTTTQRQTIEGYLSKKWGIGSSSSIPSTHPFSSIRPHLRTFQPIDVPGCALWLDAADQSSMTLSGSSVVTILDKSGNGFNLTGGSGWTYNVTKFNSSYPSFYRATKGSMLGQNNTFSITSSNITVFFVGQVINTSGQYYLVDGGSAGTNRFYTIIDTSTNIVHGNTVNADNNYSLPSTVFQPFIFSQSTGTSPQTGSYNGTAINASAGTVGTITWNGITVGGRFTNASDWWSGHICEVIIYNTLLTTSQRQQVEGYLAHKWGLSLSLPVISPLSIPGCQLWFDAADSSTVAFSSGSNVSSWTNKGIVSTTAIPTRGPSANQITYVTVDGYPGVYINNNGSIQYNASTYSQLTIQSNFQNTEDYSVFAVVNLSNVTNASLQTIYGNERGTSGETRSPNFGAGQLLEFNAAGGSRVIDLSFIGSGRLQTALISSSSALTAYTNATAYGSNTNGLTRFSTDAGPLPRIGGAFGSINDPRFATGYFHEILFYNSALTTSQRQQIEGYLARKWGISISATLPSPHPFKSFPPASLPFSPRNISGLALWLDAADQSSMTLSGSNVTQIRDKSSNAYTFTGSAGSYPTRTATLNGLPVISSATGQYLQTTSFNQNFLTATSFFVIRPTQTVTGSPGYYPVFHGTVIQVMETGIVSDYGTVHYTYLNQSGTGLMYSDPIGFNPVNRTVLASTLVTGSASTNQAYINGSLNRTGGENGTFTQLTSQTLNCIGRPTLSFGFEFAEAILYGTALTTSQRQQVEGYLAQKWGLTTSLPATHPYKKLPA
jgi:hypothetical protein